MLNEIFYWLFSMSITASVTGLLVMLIRSIKKIPRRFTVFLWSIPFLRMTLPFGLNSPYSLMSLLSKSISRSVTVYQPTDYTEFSMMNFVMAADTYFPITYKTNTVKYIFSAAAAIWLTVSSIILLILAAAYFTSLNEIKNSIPMRDNIYLSDNITSPAVYGIIKPKIILPVSCEKRDIELILLHEKMHIRSADNLWRLLALVIASVHWFNPFCRLFLNLFLADIEFSCDERVLSRLSDDRKKEYALELLGNSRKDTFLTSSFGGAKTRNRIENILSFRKPTLLSLSAFTVLSIFIFYVLMTNAG